VAVRTDAEFLENGIFSRFSASQLGRERDFASDSAGASTWRRRVTSEYSIAVRENVMKIVPVIKSGDLERSVRFYTQVLDFERKWPGYEDREMANGVIDLVRDGAELQLSRHSGDGVFGSVNRVFVEDVDERFVTFRMRGLDTTARPESPIHTAPVNQTWGLREFAVTDPDGNGLCFCMPMKSA
jgi:catechol 2,3-dioxygenase-like lactoylglutathione lyase family enzyme